MREARIIIGALVLALAASGSAAATPSCDVSGSTPVGQGLHITKICTVPLPTGPDATDAYYVLVTNVRPGPGFENSGFGKDSLQGKIFKSLLKAVFNYDKATKVDVSLAIDAAGTSYPAMPLLSFQQDNNDHWTSHVQSNPQSLYHKLNATQFFDAKLEFRYSKSTRAELEPAVDLVKSLGVVVVTPAAEPIITAAGKLAKQVAEAADVVAVSGYERNFGPSANQTSEIEFQIFDPKSRSLVATINLKLLGSRSLLNPAQPLEAIGTTLPTGAVDQIALSQLPMQMATGEAKNWSLLNNALASAQTISDVLGKTPDANGIRSFCTSVAQGLSRSFRLSSFDNLIARATLVQQATAAAQPQVNPYQTCFSTTERAVIRTSLGIDTEFQPSVATRGNSLKSFDTFVTLGCFLTAKTGDLCGSDNDDKMIAALADTVKIDALEITDATLAVSLPADRAITKSTFKTLFKGKFARFHDIDGSAGLMVVNESNDGPPLRLTAEVDNDQKIKFLRIQR
jgi:hypothetical protein